MKTSKAGKERFKERLQAAMRRRKIGIEELGEMVGVSYEMARRYVAGQGIPRDHQRTEKLARILQVDVDWLLYGEGPGLPAKIQHLVPLFNLGDKKLSFDPKSWKGMKTVASPHESFRGIAAKMPAPMGCTLTNEAFKLFKQGDIVFIAESEGELPSNTVVVIEAKKRGSERRYLVRKMQYEQQRGEKLSASYASWDPRRFADLFPASHAVFGVVAYVLASISI